VDAWRLLVAAVPGRWLRSVTLCDFHHLPGALAGVNAPVVQRVRRDGAARVYDTVLAAPYGRCDVMFPTDFAALEAALWAAYGGSRGAGSSRVLSQPEFFRDFSTDDDIAAATCRDGYNPVLSEFRNASVLTADFAH
jgi:hypothetical protein